MNTAAARVRRSGAAACAKHPREGGFTYIGLLILVAMIGVAVTLVSEMWVTAQKREKEQELLFVGNQFRRALAMYRANGGGYPRELKDLIKDPRVPGVRRYLRKIYRDPITGDAEWGLLRTNGTDGFITGVYSLSEATPLKQAQFNLADADFEKKSKYSEWVFVAGPAQGSNSIPLDPTANRTQSRVRR